MIDKNTKMFDNISLSDIFKKIYNNSEDKSTKIDTILDTVKDLLNNIADASIMLPIIKEVLEISVKNDEQLVKLAAIIQRILDKNTDVNSDSSSMLSAEEKQKLLEIDKSDNNVKLTESVIDEKIIDLEKRVEKAKTFIRDGEKSLIKEIDDKNNYEKKK